MKTANKRAEEDKNFLTGLGGKIDKDGKGTFSFLLLMIFRICFFLSIFCTRGDFEEMSNGKGISSTPMYLDKRRSWKAMNCESVRKSFHRVSPHVILKYFSKSPYAIMFVK